MGETHFAGRVIAGADAPALVAGDFALSAGYGTTASVAVAAGSKDHKGKITITSAGTGQGANPTCTLTFKEAFAVAPIVALARGNEAGDDQPLIPFTVRATTTQLILTFIGTPVAADTHTLYWACF